MPEKPSNSGVLSQVLQFAIPFLVLFGFVWGFFGSDVRELSTGEDVTITEISGCTAEGSAVGGQTPYCAGKWRFDDGRTGGGRIEGGKTTEGDKVFVGDGFAYSSRSSLIWSVSLNGLLGLFLLGLVVVGAVLHRLDKARQRREE
ncbi:hypothetical protein [Amycolatopsis sp. cmx-11-51]|uniref:hypothetical protein n=1 Tax=unclassified Amycolatopsis TaxID=2618356 RepID=UPI0039E3A4E8